MVTRVDIYNRDDHYGSRLRNVEVRLTDELPPSGDQMYTGGQLLGTFAGPGTPGQIIKVEGPARTGRYVLIQMNSRDCLNLHEVETFGGVDIDTECKEAQQPDVEVNRYRISKIVTTVHVIISCDQSHMSIHPLFWQISSLMWDHPDEAHWHKGLEGIPRDIKSTIGRKCFLLLDICENIHSLKLGPAGITFLYVAMAENYI